MNSPDELSAVLRSWRHEPAPAPDFAAGVWARIHAAPTRRHSQIIPFRLALPLAASLAIVAGVGTGIRVNRVQANERMAAAYARTIDPLQMTALPTAAAGHHHHPR